MSDNPQTQEVSAEELESFRKTLSEAIELVEADGADYVVGGSIACNHWGRPTSIGDVDLVVRPPDAKRLLRLFDERGYETEETQPSWLYKARRDGKTVDLIFELEGPFYLDDEMVAKATIADVEGTRLRLMGAEDFVVTQALATKEDTPDYWYNGLAVIARADLDWDYLVDRASRGPRRVLSHLLFADSLDLPVPESAVKRLFEVTYGR